MYTYVYMEKEREKENMIVVLAGLSEGTKGKRERENMTESE
jgi:hypothetical protein